MIKKVVKASVFLLVVAFAFIHVSYALRPHESSFLHIQTYGMQPKDSIDVVYFGGSSCFTYWAPMEAWAQYGFTSFNFANNTMPAQLEKYCLIEALKKQSPKLLVVDVRPFEYAEDFKDNNPKNPMLMFDDAPIRNFSDSFRYSFNRFQMIENGIPKENDRMNYHFDIAKYHTNLTALLAKNNWKYAFNRPDDNSKNFGGFDFCILHDVIERTDNRNIMEELPLSDTLDPIYLDLVNYCTSLDTNVLFIVPPYAESEENHRKHNYMGRVAEENGITFLDCNDIFDEIGLDVQTDFYNGNHTEIFGAKKYTKWLGQYMQNAFGLPDRRGESKYAEWDAAYDIWVTKSSEAEQAVLALMPEDIQAKILEIIR